MHLKKITFGLLGVIMLVLATATVVEKVFDTGFAGIHIYHSVPFVVLWGAIAISGLAYLFRKKTQKHLFTFLIHLSFIVILLGAFTTWLLGEQGTLHLSSGEKTSWFVNDDGEQREFPFEVSLNGFRVVYYEGTQTPQDYISKITLNCSSKTIQEEVAMNKIVRYMGYRFYQSGFDDDGQGIRLLVSHDPWGIGITYSGYAMLLLSMLLFLFGRQSNFRKLINSPLLRKTLLVVLLLFSMLTGVQAAPKPNVLPPKVAKQFADLHVLYNGRICPFQTLARDFTVKLYGKPTYNGYSAEQVLTGWMFYPTQWEKEAMIKIKGKSVCHLLDINGRYASLADFADRENRYKLENILQQLQRGETVADKQDFLQANEKVNIISILYSGRMLKLFPVKSGETINWYAPGDALPEDMPNDQWIFIRKSMDYVHEMVMAKDFANLSELLNKLCTYQQKEAGNILPSKAKFRAEKIYNQFDYTRHLAFLLLTVGLIAFVYSIRKLANQQLFRKSVVQLLNLLLVTVWLYLSVFIVLRGFIAGHFPVSNGFETMQFLAWSIMLLTLFLQKKFTPMLAFGSFMGGLALLVSTMGKSNPQITQLMPVLSSPLLSIHVVVIMVAYSLLAFIMLNGFTALILHYVSKNPAMQIRRLHVFSQIMLYPAIFFLATGIFVGAVWANISWGRYWGWDPKEVWALITLLVYSLALHTKSLRWFSRPLYFHWFSIVAFLTVLITYFGVNFILGGMHSYAG